jgi:hypothetical protein
VTFGTDRLFEQRDAAIRECDRLHKAYDAAIQERDAEHARAERWVEDRNHLARQLADLRDERDSARAEAAQQRDLCAGHTLEWARQAVELDAAKDALARVRKLHRRTMRAMPSIPDSCAHCTSGDRVVSWPCETIQAIRGLEEDDGGRPNG